MADDLDLKLTRGASLSLECSVHLIILLTGTLDGSTVEIYDNTAISNVS
jgi:hypothetical protein